MAQAATKKRRKPQRKTVAWVPREAGKRAGPGQPRSIELDATSAKILQGLGRIQATTKEAAAFFHVAENCFLNFLDREPEARRIFDEAKGEGKISLRRAQFQRALGGSDTMQIWLGKQWLGQADKIEHGGEGLNVTFNIMGLPQPGQQLTNQGDNEGENATQARPARPRAIEGDAFRVPDPTGRV